MSPDNDGASLSRGHAMNSRIPVALAVVVCCGQVFVELTAELRAEGGTLVRRVAEERSSKELQGKRGGYGFAAQLPLNDAAPGIYVIHVEARANIRERPTVSRDIQIRIR